MSEADEISMFFKIRFSSYKLPGGLLSHKMSLGWFLETAFLAAGATIA